MLHMAGMADCDDGRANASAAALFSAFALRDMTLSNRICVSPMSQYSSDRDGRATGWHQMHYGNLAVSGAGLVIVEATYVSRQARSTPGDLGLWTEEQAEGLRDLLSFCREYSGSKLGLQLSHAGRKGAAPIPWTGEEPADWPILAPSAIAFAGRKVPETMDEAQIERVVRDFARAAELAEDAGFDLLEIHNGHGYLLHSFLSPLTNQRGDSYGGDIDGRMRLPLQVFSAVRAAWPAHKPLGVRLTSTDWLEGGWDLDDSVLFARKLRELGCDYVVASSGGLSPDQKIRLGPGYQIPFAETIRRKAGIPTLAIGMISSPAQANDVIAEGKADLVGLGRGMLYNPRWAWHAARTLGADADFPPQYERAMLRFHPATGGAEGASKGPR